MAERPRVVGEFDERGGGLVCNLSELTPAIRERPEFLDVKERRPKTLPLMTRTPYFCCG